VKKIEKKKRTAKKKPVERPGKKKEYSKEEKEFAGGKRYKNPTTTEGCAPILK